MILIRIFSIGFLMFIPLISTSYAIENQKMKPFHEPYPEPFNFIFKDKILPLPVTQERPTKLDETEIYNNTDIDHLTTKGNHFTACKTILPHNTKNFPNHIGRTSRFIAANAAQTTEAIFIQSNYSGLRGPLITVTRKDIERGMNGTNGSSSEIFHNTKIDTQKHINCPSKFRIDFDLTLKTQIDLFDSNKGSLYRMDAIGASRAHIGKNFIASIGIRVPIYENLYKDNAFTKYNNDTSISGDSYYLAGKSLNLDHATLNSFFTLKPDLYLATQIGYIEERFFGIGNEILYRPNGHSWAIGADAWAVMKRDPFNPSGIAINDNNKRHSIMLNTHYDFPRQPIAIGLSAGRFIGGDYGSEINARYKGKSGWMVDGFIRYSNESDQRLDQQKTNIFTGIALTMPIGQFRTLPDHSRLITEIKPFGRNKAQRISNQYPLYDLTDPWSTANIYQNWNDITK